MTWMQPFAAWWLDFFAGATVLLAVVLIAGLRITQPVQRMAMGWSAIVGLFVLAACCAAPNWPRVVCLGSHGSTRMREKPASTMTSAEELLGTLKPEHLLSARPKRTPGVEIMAVEDADTVKRIQLPVPKASKKFDYLSLIPPVVLSVSIFTIAWLVLGRLRAGRLCRRAIPAPEFAQQELRTLVGAGIRLPKLLVSDTIATAGAIGLWQPIILLPTDAVQVGASDASLRAILAHECAHIERGDLWLLALGRLLLVVLYLHPAYWLLRRRISADQELLADAAAATFCGRHKYAETLVAWARHQPRGGARLNWGLGIWERPSQISRRIGMLLDERTRLRMACSRGWRVVNGCTMIVVVVGLSFLTLNPAPIAQAESKSDVPVAANLKAPQTSEAKPQAVDVAGTCVDEKRKPVTDARVRLFRIDHSDTIHSPPQGRYKCTQPGVKINGSAAGLLGGASSGWGDAAVQRVLEETRTDAEGKFRFANVPTDKEWLTQASEHWVVVQAPGRGTQVERAYLREDTASERIVDPISVTLQSAASVRGRITNSEGQPVAGAIVWNCEFIELATPTPGIMCSVTDADGRYVINDMSPVDIDTYPEMPIGFATVKYMSFVLSVQHKDYAPGVIEYKKVPATVDHVLERRAHAHGQVVLEDSGQPVEKACVHWTHENGMCDTVWADAKGNYSTPRLLPGKYTVRAGRNDRLDRTQDVVLTPGDHQVDLRLAMGGFIKGRVLENATGKAPTFNRSMGAEVHTYLEGHDPSRTCTGWIKEDGSFLATVEPGRNVIVFANQEWKLKDGGLQSAKTIDVTKGQTAEIELRVSPRKGGWAALLGEAQLAQAAAKGEPARTVKPAPPEEEPSTGDKADDEMLRAFRDYPDEALPAEPMSAKAALAMLPTLVGDSASHSGGGSIGSETIDGEECITSINFCSLADVFDPDMAGLILSAEYGILAHINELPHLKGLMLFGGPADDKWLEPLRGHKQLELVYFCYPKKLTGTGIKHLATLPYLKTVLVSGPKIGDDVLLEIGRLPHIEALQFFGRVTDRGVATLKGNSKLKTLTLGGILGSKLTDKCLQVAGSMPNMEELQLGIMGESDLTDEGLAQLTGLTKLKTLEVSGPNITDAGLVHLYAMKRLKSLTVNDTSVTQHGIEELKKHLPELKVTSPVNESQKAEALKSSPAERQR
jgi:beta-lactamase regulating signal transducer with metallopeptidase domain